MNKATRPSSERRVLILAPTGRDAQLTQSVLAEVGIRSTPCEDLATFGREMAEGAGALLLSEEAVMSESDMFFLGERLARQPPWSDLPVLLLAHTGADSAAVRKAIRALGNVTLLERPVRVASLVSAAQTALRARNRQYRAREHLQELDEVATALTDSEGRLQALFANAAVGIAELTDDGRFALVNDALCRILGHPREALVGSTLFEHAHAEDRDDIASAYRGVMETARASFSGERRFERRDGDVMWAKLSITGTPHPIGASMRAVAVIEDVTERRRAEHDLREAARRRAAERSGHEPAAGRGRRARPAAAASRRFRGGGWRSRAPGAGVREGWGQSEDRRRTQEAGFDHHLVKPADLSTLQSILSPEGDEARGSLAH